MLRGVQASRVWPECWEDGVALTVEAGRVGEGPTSVLAVRWAGLLDIQGTWLSWHRDRSLASGELHVQRAAWTEKREAARGPSHACSAHRRRWGGAVTEARTARGTEGLQGMASWPEFPKPASCWAGRDRNSTLTGLLQGSSGDKGGSERYKTGREHTDTFPRHADLDPGP